MRTFKYLVLALIVVCLVVLALANRKIVTLHLLPEAMSRVMPVSLRVPLFVVVLLSALVGMIAGYLLEWLREHKHRRRAAQKAREAAQLSGEVDRLRRQSGKPEDDVLALIGN